MSICLLPWTTDATLLPGLLEDVANVIEQFEQGTPSPCSSQGGSIEELATTDSSNQVGGNTSREPKLSFSLNVSKFKPDELKVGIDSRTLTVEGKQERKEGSTHTVRSFLRHWILPEGVDFERTRSALTEDGHLVIEVPKLRPAIRNVPIEVAVDLQ
uniref:SHSP domain-containing protein n=1 Tax=Haemonchus contortus TaxID=6289 RepID=A0A7I4XVB3_HAECO